jgi:hypothetical protein
MRTRLSVVRPKTRPSEPPAEGMASPSDHQSGDDAQAKIRAAHAPNAPIAPKSRLEAARSRRGAVDGEVLRYLGALAKKDPEGFVYPSIRHIADKIGRSCYYLGLRIQFLEGTGRLIPTRRVRHSRELEGWIVLRYKEWAKSHSCQLGAASRSTPDNLAESLKSLPKTPNNLGPRATKPALKSLTAQADKRAMVKGRSCSGRRINEDDALRSQSQSTGTATTTSIIRGAGQSFKCKKDARIERLIAKNLREGETLRQCCEEFRGTEKEVYLDVIPAFREACKFLAYSINEEDPSLTWHFCADMKFMWEDYKPRLRDGAMSPSKFCSKLIDSCVEGEVPWPPSFGKHRDRLREAEKTDRLAFHIEEREGSPPIYLGVDPESLPTLKQGSL